MDNRYEKYINSSKDQIKTARRWLLLKTTTTKQKTSVVKDVE